MMHPFLPSPNTQCPMPNGNTPKLQRANNQDRCRDAAIGLDRSPRSGAFDGMFWEAIAVPPDRGGVR
ncbi:MAG: hypothetical protein V7K14_30595 [Nostoc sp.]|uniref:hypothetical protein n=1 Tax=Nostoc sp. TaxID=1180 RepID=UPI002FF4A04D